MSREWCERCEEVEVEGQLDYFGFSIEYYCDNCRTAKAEQAHEAQFESYWSGGPDNSESAKYKEAVKEKYGVSV